MVQKAIFGSGREEVRRVLITYSSPDIDLIKLGTMR
jgi:hypothetical protein